MSVVDGGAYAMQVSSFIKNSTSQSTHHPLLPSCATLSSPAVCSDGLSARERVCLSAPAARSGSPSPPAGSAASPPQSPPPPPLGSAPPSPARAGSGGTPPHTPRPAPPGTCHRDLRTAAATLRTYTPFSKSQLSQVLIVISASSHLPQNVLELSTKYSTPCELRRYRPTTHQTNRL